MDDGILTGPVETGRRRPPEFPVVEARPGLRVVERASGRPATVVDIDATEVALLGQDGVVRPVRLLAGRFLVDGRACSLRAPAATPAVARRGPSGSLPGPTPPRARVARASRILVEGVHDAELVEAVWGDDLRHEGVVVERLDGMDGLAEVVDAFGPGPGRRLGVLLDHLVPGSKEERAAQAARGPHVLVTGTPYVDVWAAVRPRVLGLTAWPQVPPGEPWKHGVLARIGSTEEPGRFWRRLLGAVRGYEDLEPALVGAVEALIDFVTDEP